MPHLAALLPFDQWRFRVGCGMKWILLLSLALASCTSYKESERALQKIYVGKNVDKFFLHCGPPAARHVLNSGGSIYTWIPSGAFVNMPGRVYSNGNVVNFTPPRTVQTGCEVELITDPKGTVQKIIITKDSWGAWTTSWAHEFFAAQRKHVKGNGATSPQSIVTTSGSGTHYLQNP